jgi:osmoprotectant transport system permease protein
VSVVRFLAAHRDEFLALLGQHLFLVAISTSVAVAIGVPLGVLAARRPRVGAPVVWLVNAAQTIPSLAMFGFLLPLPFIGGLGARVAITVLIVYALLPIVRTTVAGISSVDPALVEAGTALGMTPRQLLRQVQLPLAMPSIVAGIRVAAVIGVGTATIAAAVGAGGLGEYIFRGLAMVDPTVILAGAIPAAILALAIAVAAIVVTRATAPPVIRVGSKNFTEQIVLGEILAQAIEAQTRMKVERRLNLGGTFICDRAIRTGDIDVYVEYTGTAHTAIFRQAVETDSRRVFEAVRERYAEAGLSLFDPLGFENTFAILVRGSDAAALGLKTIEDAAPHAARWQAGFGYEFLQRADGYPGLAKTYGLSFRAPPRAMDLSLIYRALADGQVDLVAGDATSGLIEAYALAMLQDNRRYFPPYDAAAVARSSTLLAYPDVRRALASLSGAITVADMRRMNHAVDAGRREPADVAREFLAKR